MMSVMASTKVIRPDESIPQCTQTAKTVFLEVSSTNNILMQQNNDNCPITENDSKSILRIKLK